MQINEEGKANFAILFVLLSSFHSLLLSHQSVLYFLQIFPSRLLDKIIRVSVYFTNCNNNYCVSYPKILWVNTGGYTIRKYNSYTWQIPSWTNFILQMHHSWCHHGFTMEKLIWGAQILRYLYPTNLQLQWLQECLVSSFLAPTKYPLMVFLIFMSSAQTPFLSGSIIGGPCSVG